MTSVSRAQIGNGFLPSRGKWNEVMRRIYLCMKKYAGDEKKATHKFGRRRGGGLRVGTFEQTKGRFCPASLLKIFNKWKSSLNTQKNDNCHGWPGEKYIKKEKWNWTIIREEISPGVMRKRWMTEARISSDKQSATVVESGEFIKTHDSPPSEF